MEHGGENKVLGGGQDWQRTEKPTSLSDISTAYDQGNSIAPTWRLIMTGPERFTRHQPRQTMRPFPTSKRYHWPVASVASDPLELVISLRIDTRISE